MHTSPGLRNRPGVTLLALAFGILGVHGTAHAELLINDWSDRATALTVSPQDWTRVTAPVAFRPCGPLPTEPSAAADAGAWLALVGVCIHPPIQPGQPGGGTVISSAGGGGSKQPGGGGHTDPGGGHTASSSPEPGTLVIGVIGAGVAGLTNLARRKRWRAAA